MKNRAHVTWSKDATQFVYKTCKMQKCSNEIVFSGRNELIELID